VGALYTPRTAVLIPNRADCPAGACRSTTASPSTPLQHPTLRGSALRGINEGSSNSPVRSSPRPRPPGWNGPPLGLSPELRTTPTKSRTTHVGMGTGHRARTWNYQLNITSGLILQSGSSLNTCDLASHVRKGQSSGRLAGGCFLVAKLSCGKPLVRYGAGSLLLRQRRGLVRCTSRSAPSNRGPFS
jgi:hypothetical protein